MVTYNHYKEQVEKQENKIKKLLEEKERLIENLPTEEDVQREDDRKLNFGHYYGPLRSSSLKRLSALEDQITRARESLLEKNERFRKSRAKVVREVTSQLNEVSLLEKSSVDSYWMDLINESARMGDGLEPLLNEMEDVLVYLRKLVKVSDKMEKEFGSVEDALEVLRSVWEVPTVAGLEAGL